MLSYFKFRQELFDPVPARDVYIQRKPGRGWQEECPPVRSANSFGFDLLANFDLTFLRKPGGWKVKDDIIIDSDFDWAGSEESPGAPLTQQYAWFWEKGQTIPHVIDDHVFPHLSNQVKVCSFLFLKTDPNELLLMTEIPNLHRPYRTMSAVIETDWYPASYPWHIVLDLDPSQKRIDIKKGDPLARLIPVRRDTYFAQQMSPEGFDAFFARSQQWIGTHGRVVEEGVADITKTYVRQQTKAKFVVMT
jgi:hypothetical protein